jgi:hypothetical protein
VSYELVDAGTDEIDVETVGLGLGASGLPCPSVTGERATR